MKGFTLPRSSIAGFHWFFIIAACLLIGCASSVEVNEQEQRPDAATIPATAVPPTSPATAATASAGAPPPSPSVENSADADVLFVRAEETAAGVWTFHVTVAHPDTGWEDYTDGWDVLLPDGTVLLPDPDAPFTRLLLHPHENEQPFTRSQNNITIPADTVRVTVRAHDLVDGYGGEVVVVDLDGITETEFYAVTRLDD